MSSKKHIQKIYCTVVHFRKLLYTFKLSEEARKLWGDGRRNGWSR